MEIEIGGNGTEAMECGVWSGRGRSKSDDVKADGDGIFACVDVACWISHTYVFASSTCQFPGGDHAFQVETTPDRRIVVSRQLFATCKFFGCPRYACGPLRISSGIWTVVLSLNRILRGNKQIVYQ